MGSEIYQVPMISSFFSLCAHLPLYTHKESQVKIKRLFVDHIIKTENYMNQEFCEIRTLKLATWSWSWPVLYYGDDLPSSALIDPGDTCPSDSCAVLVDQSLEVNYFLIYLDAFVQVSSSYLCTHVLWEHSFSPLQLREFLFWSIMYWFQRLTLQKFFLFLRSLTSYLQCTVSKLACLTNQNVKLSWILKYFKRMCPGISWVMPISSLAKYCY